MPGNSVKQLCKMKRGPSHTFTDRILLPSDTTSSRQLQRPHHGQLPLFPAIAQVAWTRLQSYSHFVVQTTRLQLLLLLSAKAFGPYLPGRSARSINAPRLPQSSVGGLL